MNWQLSLFLKYTCMHCMQHVQTVQCATQKSAQARPIFHQCTRYLVKIVLTSYLEANEQFRRQNSNNAWLCLGDKINNKLCNFGLSLQRRLSAMLRWRDTKNNDIHDFSQVAILFQPWAFTQLAFHSAVSQLQSMARHRSQQVSVTQCQPSRSCEMSSSWRHRLVLQTIFLQLCETYEAKTARAGSSAICAGTLVSLLPRDAHTRYYSCVLPVNTEYIAVLSRAGEIDTNVPAQMADEPARTVLASYVSYN